MGSSQASAMCLKAILRLPGLEVVGVVTQPDRPAGRGKVLTPCRCRAYAEERGIKSCITPENVNDPEALAQIRAWKPDVIVVVAFGQFLKEELLNLPPLGCVNCHFSLLPKYRGASPVTAALLAPLFMGTVLHLVLCPAPEKLSLESIRPLWAEGQALRSGGVIAGALADAGELLMSKIVSLIVFGLLFALAVIAALRWNPVEAWKRRREAEEREEILAYVESQDLRSAAEQTLNRLFASLAISNPLEKPQEGNA